MSGSRVCSTLSIALLHSAILLADERAATTAATSPANAPATSGMRLHLMEGSVVTGRLSIDALAVETDFGKLDVPVASIVSFTPGLDSHPVERRKITRLIQQLGSNAAAEREAAQKALSETARLIQHELARYASDEDLE